ncbi:MAG: ATP-binding protein, partial [Nocardioidaceae bacterium]
MWNVYLLGEKRVVDSSATTHRRPSARSVELLALLVLHPGAPQARRHLAGQMWPDSTDSQSLTNLRRELHSLRMLLEDDPALVVEPADLSWQDTTSCRVDVRTFEQERSAAVSDARSGATEGLLRHATAALHEYRGDLLPGLYDDWVLEHRERLHRGCVDLCDQVVSVLSTAGDPRRAVAAARRRIQLEPLEEIGYRTLISLQSSMGDRSAAMATYHRCVSTLERELGIGPDAETVDLANRLLKRSPSPLTSAATRVERPHGKDRAMVGRDDELARLISRWEQAERGEAGLVLVSGEAGVGKSRLLSELAAHARSGGALTATTRCFGSSGGVPLAPVADWIRRLSRQSPLVRLNAVWQTEVARLVPLAVDARSPTSAPEGPATENPALPKPTREVTAITAPSRALVDSWQRHRFFEGLAQAVLFPERATLLVLDDLQWCDGETAAWLTYLLNLARGSSLLVAATLRAEELADNVEVADSLHRLRQRRALHEVNLAPLEPDDTTALAQDLLGRTLTTEEQALLHMATGGCPLFVIELIRNLGPTSARLQPIDVHTIFEQRLRQATPIAQEVAELASAVGRDFTLDLLSEAGDHNADTVVRAIDELWRRRIVSEQPVGYDFTHDLLRNAAYDGISPARRWLTHQRLAQGMELLGVGHLDNVAGQIAEQYDRAGRTDRALPYYSRAAQAAVAMFANLEAIRQYRRCLDLLRRLHKDRERDSQELDLLRAMSPPLNALYGYSSKELQATQERSVALAEAVGSTEVLLSSLVGLWAVTFVQGRTARAHELAQRAVEIAASDKALAGPPHLALGGSGLSLGKPAFAVEHFELAVEMSGSAVSLTVGTRPEVQARAWAAHAHWLLGNWDSSAALSVEAIERARAVGNPYGLAVALAYASVTRRLYDDVAALR